MKNRFKFNLVILFILCFLPTKSYTQKSLPVIEKFIKYNDSINTLFKLGEKLKGLDSVDVDKLSLPSESIRPELNTFLKANQTQLKSEAKINGILGFGLTLQNSENQDLSQFTISAKGNRGFYPGEFKFDSKIVAQVQDGKFIENLSNLSMSYDHHIGNKLATEGYVFLKRSTNNFLNIDQRYEAGGGVVWNVFLSGKNLTLRENRVDELDNGSNAEKKKMRRRSLTKKGIKIYEGLRSYQLDSQKYLSEDSSYDDIGLCSDELCLADPETLSDEEKEWFKKDLKKSIFSTLKEHSKVRVSILGGINYETERTIDSVKLRSRNAEDQTRFFAPVNLVRAVVAPGIELKIDKFELKSRAYFKLAISDDDLKNEVVLNEQTDSRTDYRLEFLNSASLKFDEKIKIKATLNFVQINAPRRSFIGIGGEDQLFIAARRFINFNMGFEYKL